MTSARSSCKDLLERILPGSPQDLLTRTSTRSCKSLVEDRSPQDLLFEDRFKITQGPLRGRLRDLHKIFLGQGPVTGFHQDLQNIFSQGPLQDLAQDMKLFQGGHRGTFQRIHKTSLPEYQGISWNQQRATTRANQHAENAEMRAISKFAPRNNESDLTCRKWRQGCGFQPFFCRSLQSICEKKAPAKPRPILRASLLSWNAHGHLRRGRLCEKFQGKCFRPKPRRSSCARLRNRNEHGQRIYSKNATPQRAYPDLTPAFNFSTYRKNLSTSATTDARRRRRRAARSKSMRSRSWPQNIGVLMRWCWMNIVNQLNLMGVCEMNMVT